MSGGSSASKPGGTAVDLGALAGLLRERARVDSAIADLLGRAPHRGAVGEAIAAAVFGIALNRSGSEKGHDGVFTWDGRPDQRVNVKYYARWEGLLDLHVGEAAPDWYLVLVGGSPDGWGIAEVLVFSHAELLAASVRPGVAASVRAALHEGARVYPTPHPRWVLSEEQRDKLAQFRG